MTAIKFSKAEKKALREGRVDWVAVANPELGCTKIELSIMKKIALARRCRVCGAKAGKRCPGGRSHAGRYFGFGDVLSDIAGRPK